MVLSLFFVLYIHILFYFILELITSHVYDNEYPRSILFVHAKEMTALKRLTWTTVRILLIKAGNENIPRWFIITSLFLHTKNIGLRGIWWNTLTIVRIKVQKIEWVTTLNNHILCFRVFSLVAFTDAQDSCESLLSFSVRKMNKCRNVVVVVLFMYNIFSHQTWYFIKYLLIYRSKNKIRNPNIRWYIAS